MTNSSVHQSLVVILAPDDFRHVGPDSDLLPLRPDLYLRALDEYEPSRVLDVGSIMSRRDLVRARACGLRVLHDLLDAVRSARSEPWLEGMNFHYLKNHLPLLHYFQVLFTRLAGRYGSIHIPLEYYQDRSWDVGYGTIVAKAARYAAEKVAAQGTTRFRARGKALAVPSYPKDLARFAFQWLRHVLGAALVRLQGRVPGLLRSRSGASATPCEPADLVLAGVQVTDVVWQVSLAEILWRRMGSRMVWITGDPAANLEENERKLFSGRNADVRSIRAGDVQQCTWRWWPLQAWTLTHTAWRLARMARRCRHMQDFGQSLLCGMFTDLCPSGTSLQWRKWADLLDRIRPRVVVGSSDLFEMAFFSAWCRRRKVPFLQLTHGVAFNSIDFMRDTFGDAAVVHGEYWKRMFDRFKGRAQRSAHVAGPLFLADETGHGIAPGRSGEDSDQVLLMETLNIGNPMHASQTDLIAWYLAVGRAAARAGSRLLLRGHPRAPAGDFYHRVAEMIRREGGSCSVDEGSSLMAGLRGSFCCVARVFENACAKALLVGTPLVAYVPFPMWHPSDALVRHMALPATGVDDLAHVFRRLREDPAWTASVRERQRRKLEDVVDYRVVDGWDRVAHLAEQMVDGVPGGACRMTTGAWHTREATVA